ncbi:MAG: 16S rRNA (guanine(966)-N(2))-methyltransferase RsmD, partial [Candidatus Omnitrophica bacterium]|nr:16S rRNA (guanine(966)-N(2))-methyltransferase RsmD [Candidatus Omnitrophota bacterium]
GLRFTEEKVRKAIFDVLGSYVEGKTLLELFSGSGGIGIEAFSRGAREVTFVDSNISCIDAIKKNVPLELKEKSTILHFDFLRAIEHLDRVNKKFDLVIMDPPYKSDLVVLVLKKIFQSDILARNSLIIVEHHRDEKINDPSLYGLYLLSHKRYGVSCVSFFKFLDKQDGKSK